MDKQQRFLELKQLVQQHKQAYYKGEALITDAQYDAMELELLELAEEFNLVSAVQTVGTQDLAASFASVKHKLPMLSLDKVHNQEDLVSKLEKMSHYNNAQKWMVWPKFDGTSLSVTYQDGKLVQLATRGDGIVGEDITAHHQRIVNLPNEIPGFSGELRGEVVMLKSDLAEYNASNPLTPLSNVRNGAAGTLRALNPQLVKGRKLYFYAYDIIGGDKDIISSLSQIKFEIEKGEIFSSVKEVLDYITNIEEERESLNYEIDGVVIRLASPIDYLNAGFTGHHPKGAIAFKLSSQTEQTTLEKIVWQVNRRGIVSPVGIVIPTLLGGATVSRVSLHNTRIMQNLDLKLQDKVMITRAGDVIPHLVSVLTKERTGQEQSIDIPTSCPSCQSSLHVEGESLILFCLNYQCPAQRLHRIKHWASRSAADIEFLAEKQIDKLLQEGLIHNIPDLYRLKEDDILQLEGYQKRSVQRLLESIQKSKGLGMEKMLVGLSVPNASTGTINKLVKAGYNNIDKLIDASVEELASVEGIAEIIAQKIQTFLNTAEIKSMIKELEELGLDVSSHYQAPTEDGTLQGKVFVITGSFDKPRSYYKQMIEQAGGSVSSAISSKTSFLLCGDKAGSKLKKAQELGVNILDLEQLETISGIK